MRRAGEPATSAGIPIIVLVPQIGMVHIPPDLVVEHVKRSLKAS